MSKDKDYVLGTHDDEVNRLALQHRVWRPRATDAWRRAGFTVGQTILDIGCGPGNVSIDLAEIVGSSGRIIAIDRSRRFLDVLEVIKIQRGLNNITPYELDLNEDALPDVHADGAWCRWVLSFVKHPSDLVKRISGALKPGGVFVLHEYLDYSTWRLAPRSSEMEEFVNVVMESWRADGGEPDIGLNLPAWLEELGFEIKTLNPIIDIVSPSNFIWQWPKAFVETGLRRLVDLGYFTKERASEIQKAFDGGEATSHTRMITPVVLEVIAVKR